MTFAADSAKSIIFHQLRWTHILTTAKNQCRLCVCKIHMCLLFCIFMFMPVCVFVFIFKVYLCLTYTSITDWLKRHRGFNLATFTEQLMCSAQVRSADSALYLKPNTSLCLYYSFIPNIFLSLFSPFSLTGSSLTLDREHFHANDVTSSIPNHHVCHRSILIPLYPLVRHTRSLALNSLAPSLSSSNIPQSLLCLVFYCFIRLNSLICICWKNIKFYPLLGTLFLNRSCQWVQSASFSQCCGPPVDQASSISIQSELQHWHSYVHFTPPDWPFLPSFVYLYTIHPPYWQLALDLQKQHTI